MVRTIADWRKLIELCEATKLREKRFVGVCGDIAVKSGQLLKEKESNNSRDD